MRRISGFSAIVIGGTIAGACDITYAITFWAFRGVSATRVLQSVASGLLGAPAIKGGLATAALGLALHFFIAFSAATIFYLAAKSHADTHSSRISLRHSLWSRHLCGDESGGPAAFRVPAQGHVSAVGYDDGTSRSHVPDWIADRTRGASFVNRENVSLA